MTQEELIQQIERLPLEQKIGLIEAISRSLREELAQSKEGAPDGETETKQAEVSEQDGVPISQQLRGILKFEGEPPTDEEVKDAYADYLLEKYS